MPLLNLVQIWCSKSTAPTQTSGACFAILTFWIRQYIFEHYKLSTLYTVIICKKHRMTSRHSWRTLCTQYFCTADVEMKLQSKIDFLQSNWVHAVHAGKVYHHIMGLELDWLFSIYMKRPFLFSSMPIIFIWLLICEIRMLCLLPNIVSRLKLRTGTESVMPGTDATVYLRLLFTKIWPLTEWNLGPIGGILP